MDKTSELIKKRKDKFDMLKQSGLKLYPNDFKVSHSINDIKTLVEKAPKTLKSDSPLFAVAGRMMAINRFGKTMFIRFRDRTGQLQAYIR